LRPRHTRLDGPTSPQRAPRTIEDATVSGALEHAPRLARGVLVEAFAEIERMARHDDARARLIVAERRRGERHDRTIGPVLGELEAQTILLVSRQGGGARSKEPATRRTRGGRCVRGREVRTLCNRANLCNAAVSAGPAGSSWGGSARTRRGDG